MRYRLLQDVMWCGFKILSAGEIVCESTYKQHDHIKADEIVICDPVTGGKQTVVPRSYLEEIDA